MQIVAVGAPPSTARQVPTVVVGEVPLQESGSSAVCAITPSVCDAYTADIQAEISLFAGDHLDVRYAENHSYMTGTSHQMSDSVHPNALGQSNLRMAFEAVLP